MEKGEFIISNDSSELTVNGKLIVKTSITIVGSNTELPINIVADFSNIPNHLHQIYFQSLMSQYNISVNVYDNTKEDELITTKKKNSEWGLNKIVDIISKRISK
jgi:hypothetical protein